MINIKRTHVYLNLRLNKWSEFRLRSSSESERQKTPTESHIQRCSTAEYQHASKDANFSIQERLDEREGTLYALSLHSYMYMKDHTLYTIVLLRCYEYFQFSFSKQSQNIENVLLSLALTCIGTGTLHEWKYDDAHFLNWAQDLVLHSKQSLSFSWQQSWEWQKNMHTCMYINFSIS